MELHIFVQNYKVIALLLDNQNQVFFMCMINYKTSKVANAWYDMIWYDILIYSPMWGFQSKFTNI